MSYKQIKVTERGKRLIERAVTDGFPLQFSQARLSSHKYTNEELEGIISLSKTQKTAELRQTNRLGENTIQVSTVFDNKGDSGGFHAHTIGIYVLNPDYLEPEETEHDEGIEETVEDSPVEVELEETEDETPTEEYIIQEKHILYGVAIATDNPFYMPPSTMNPTTLNLKLTVGVGEAEAIILKVNQAGVAYTSDILPIKESMRELSFEVATQAVESFEIDNALNIQREMEQAESYAEIFETILTLGGI